VNLAGFFSLPSAVVLFLSFCVVAIFVSLAMGSLEQDVKNILTPANVNNTCSVSKTSKEPMLFAVFTFANDSKSMKVIQEQYSNNDRKHYVMQSIRSLPEGLWLYDELPKERKMIIIQSLDNITSALGLDSHYHLNTIVYDIEDWEKTPATERMDPSVSISKGAGIVHRAGFSYGITPDARTLIDNYKRINWTEVDFLGMQLQRFSQDLPEYSSLAKEIANFARCKNPNIEVFTQLSFRFTDAEDMIKVIENVKSLVDGFIIAYDTNNRADSCVSQCSPDDLNLVLRRINELV
jgi:hypothetical protein